MNGARCSFGALCRGPGHGAAHGGISARLSLRHRTERRPAASSCL